MAQFYMSCPLDQVSDGSRDYQTSKQRKTLSTTRKLISQSKEIKIGVYNARRSGLSYFTKELKEFLKKGGSLSFLVGFRSSPDIFDELRELEDIKSVTIGLYDESTFHSKIPSFLLNSG